MTTDADIVNRALQLIGGLNDNKAVTGSAPTFDQSSAGIAASYLYTPAIQTVARTFGWDFSRQTATLVSTGNTAQLGFAFEFAYPGSGIQIRQLMPASITDPNDPKPVDWTVGNALIGLTNASGTVTFSVNPTNGDTITLNGVVITFVSGAPSGNQVQIAGSIGLTMANLSSFFAGTPNPSLTVATYGLSTGGGGSAVWTISYTALGVAGNAYTLAASAAVVSGSALTGGTSGPGRVIWTDQGTPIAIITGQPPVTAWDSIFTEAVVRLLASEFSTALSGKPETSAAALQQFGVFEKTGEDRTDT